MGVFMNSKLFYNIHKAFTVTEILIALMIIGVLAALALPNLIEGTSSAAYNTKFKAIFSDIQQSLIHAENVQRHPFVKVGGEYDDRNDAEYTLKKYMMHHFEAPKTSRTTFPASSNSHTYKLKNGAHIIFPKSSLDIMLATGCDSGHACVAYIDVNGNQGPNEEVYCTTGTQSDDLTDACTVNEKLLSDVYPIVFKSSHIYPKTNAVNYILSK